MEVDTGEKLRLVRTAEGAVELWDPREQSLIRNGVRIGAWGVGGGVALGLLGLVGVHLPLGWLVGGIGFIGGGLASVAASIAVLRRVWKGPRLRHLTAAGVLGIPFGLSAAGVGAVVLARDVALSFRAGWVVVVMVTLGIGLTALFGSGATKHFWQLLGVDDEEDD